MKEINGWKEFSEYLLELEKTKRDCSHLIILPEDVLYKEKLEDVEYKSERLHDPELFRKGSLLCHILAFCSHGSRPKCSIKSEINLNENGELEVLCNSGYDCGYLKIKIEGFRRFNPE